MKVSLTRSMPQRCVAGAAPNRHSAQTAYRLPIDAALSERCSPIPMSSRRSTTSRPDDARAPFGRSKAHHPKDSGAALQEEGSARITF